MWQKVWEESWMRTSCPHVAYHPVLFFKTTIQSLKESSDRFTGHRAAHFASCVLSLYLYCYHFSEPRALYFQSFHPLRLTESINQLILSILEVPSQSLQLQGALKKQLTMSQSLWEFLRCVYYICLAPELGINVMLFFRFTLGNETSQDDMLILNFILLAPGEDVDEQTLLCWWRCSEFLFTGRI